MIITKLQGGLANQIFQFAYARSLSEKYKTPLYLDTTFYTSNQFGNTKRDFSLDVFPYITYNIMPNERNISLWNNENKNIVVKLDDNFHYKELVYDEKSHYYLNGYWQCEKYFNEFSALIRKELSPNETDYNRLKSMIPDKSVSIHIRRTDYVTSNGFHPVQSIEYYTEALSLIGDYENVVVFSDDIHWCKENLRYDNMIFIEGQKDYEDLWLMSLCTHNVIANSSFSWWGAWLNNNPNKKVVAPLNWFGQNANTNTSDIIPDSWIKI